MPSFWFSQARDKGLDSLASGYLQSEAMPRDSTATVDGIQESATDKGGLCYDAGTDGYEYDWRTSSTWSGCRQVVMKLKDGSVHQANFIFR